MRERERGIEMEKEKTMRGKGVIFLNRRDKKRRRKKRIRKSGNKNEKDLVLERKAEYERQRLFMTEKD